MAQFATDFSGYASGAQPSDWTERWNTGNFASTVEGSGLPAGTLSAKALRITGTVDSWYALTWDLVGSVSGDVEVLVRWHHAHTADIDWPVYLHVCVSGGVESENAYGAVHYLSVNQGKVERVSGGVETSLGAASITLDRNAWYWTRLQRSSTTIRVRMWAHGAAEPDTWLVSAVDATHTSGAVGVGRWAFAGTLWCDFFSVGTAGDPASSIRAPVLSAALVGNDIRIDWS